MLQFGLAVGCILTGLLVGQLLRCSLKKLKAALGFYSHQSGAQRLEILDADLTYGGLWWQRVKTSALRRKVIGG